MGRGVRQVGVLGVVRDALCGVEFRRVGRMPYDPRRLVFIHWQVPRRLLMHVPSVPDQDDASTQAALKTADKSDGFVRGDVLGVEIDIQLQAPTLWRRGTMPERVQAGAHHAQSYPLHGRDLGDFGKQNDDEQSSKGRTLIQRTQLLFVAYSGSEMKLLAAGESVNGVYYAKEKRMRSQRLYFDVLLSWGGRYS